MSSIINNLFSINGVISTDKTVIQNINEICNAAGCWATYDIAEGVWAVVINQAGSSIASFDDSNIIGNINVSVSSVTEMYNEATIAFPHKDLKDAVDYIDLKLPIGTGSQTLYRYTNEIDNKLNIQTDLVNDPIQAQYLANIELKQSRVDKIIQFRTDFSKISLKAGDLIDVTSDMYGYTNKMFRVTRVEEDDADVLSISITALEYDANVYSTDGLVRELREKRTGIIAKNANPTLTTNDNNAIAKANTESNYITPLLIANAIAAGVGPLFDFLKNSAAITKAGTAATTPGVALPSYATAVINLSEGYVLGEFNDFSGSTDGTDFAGNPSSSATAGFTLPTDFNTVMILVDMPYSNYTMFPRELYLSVIANAPIITAYDEINDGSGNMLVANLQYDLCSVLGVDNALGEPPFFAEPTPRDITAYIPTIGTLSYEGTTIDQKDTGWQCGNQIFTIKDAPAGEYTLEFQPSQTYEIGLDADQTMFHGYYNSSGGLGGITITIMAFKY